MTITILFPMELSDHSNGTTCFKTIEPGEYKIEPGINPVAGLDRPWWFLQDQRWGAPIAVWRRHSTIKSRSRRRIAIGQLMANQSAK